jgi:hypothetical protein
MPVSFSVLRSEYPTAAKEDLFSAMGGGWPALIDDANYANTCCIRLSLAMARAGMLIPATYKEAISGDGTPLIIKVATMGKFVEERFGKSSWGMSKNPGTDIGANTIPKRSGILVYHALWNNATGHFDLWTKSDFVGAGNFDDIASGFDIAEWFVD